MYLSVFILLLSLSFILIFLGLYRPEHSELTLMGFIFLFLLSFMILNNNLTIATGTITNSSFNYTTSGNFTLLTSSYENVEDVYTPIILEGVLAHLIGYWLAVLSILGFVGVIIGLNHSRGFK